MPVSSARGIAREAPSIGLFIIACLLALLLVRNGTAAIIKDLTGLIPVWYGLLLLFAGLFLRIRYDPAGPFMQRFGRASAIFLTVFFVTEPFALPAIGLPEGHPAVVLQAYGRWLGLALGLAAWFRPAALFGAAMTAWILRDLNAPITGFHFSNLDIRTVVEVLALIAMGTVMVGAARQNRRIAAYVPLTDHMARRILLLILAIGIGGHLGNYFYSAMAKLALDGGPLSWLFGNRLYDGLPGAMEKGTFPFMAWPAAAQFMHDAIRALNLPLHLISFAVQFCAIIAIWRRRWVMAITVAYDAFHLMVYATYGLFFWKWIALNAIILAALARVHDADWTRSMRVTLALSVLFGAIFFKTATLAWYDAPGFLSPFIEAEMRDGTRLRVPNAYFGSGSYQMSHGQLGIVPESGHFNPSIWGSVLSADDLAAARRCMPPTPDGQIAPAALTDDPRGPLNALGAYVWSNHARLVRQGRAQSWRAYAYPHHHFPAPFRGQPFGAIDPDDITAYRVVFESVCLRLEKGVLKRDVIKRTAIPLARPIVE